MNIIGLPTWTVLCMMFWNIFNRYRTFLSHCIYYNNMWLCFFKNKKNRLFIILWSKFCNSFCDVRLNKTATIVNKFTKFGSLKNSKVFKFEHSRRLDKSFASCLVVEKHCVIILLKTGGCEPPLNLLFLPSWAWIE